MEKIDNPIFTHPRAPSKLANIISRSSCQSNFCASLFFYPSISEEQNGLHHTSEKSELLQKSLSETLTLYYPLAGRYIKDKVSVECNDKSQLLSKWFHKLMPDPVESDTTPLVIVQFNMFVCGGVAIGACIAHRVADGLSCFHFIETWAKISRVGLANLQSCPSFKLASLFPSRDNVPAPRKSNNAPGDDNCSTMKRIVFSAEAISNLKAIVTGNTSTSVVSDSESRKYRPTRVGVVLAFIWMCLTRLNKARYGHFRPSLLSTAVSMQTKTILPIRKNSSGNTLTRAVARFFPYSQDIVSLVDNANEELFKGRDEPDTDCYISSSWCRFPIYEADHGWGKPSWVTMPMNKKLRNVIVLVDTLDGDGVEALVTLDESGMHIFEQNPKIIPFLAAISTLKGIATGTGTTDSESLKHQPTRVELQGALYQNCAKAPNADEIISLANKANEELLLAKDTPDVDWYVSSSWCRFPIYEADHGWGKPYWVQVLSRKLITPSSPTPEHLQSLKISYLDQLAYAMPRLFFYLPTTEEERCLNTLEKSELLQKSLSETLTLYYPLAGRYIKDKLSVECNDQGAEYLEAQVSNCLSLSQLLSSQDRSQLLSKWFHMLVPDPVESDATPLVMVQLNMFECGGLAIGVCVSHRVADGLSCFNFIETWAKFSRVGFSDMQFRPSFQLGSFFPPRDVSIPQESSAPDDKLSIKIFTTRKGTAASIAKASNADDVVTWADNGNGVLEEGTYKPDIDCYLSSSWCRFSIYEADHGRGKPSW
ncbi:hypothetical protein Tsubulata_013817, partial [Turnera subulata]